MHCHCKASACFLQYYCIQLCSGAATHMQCHCSRQYSHILIDCQPSLGMLTVNALAAANRIIIPVQAEYLPAKGLEQLLSTVSKVKRQINPKLQICHRNLFGILCQACPGITNFLDDLILRKEKVLDNISFIVGHDDKIAFVGGNEFAKTVLFKILTGEMEPDEGTYKSETSESLRTAICTLKTEQCDKSK